MLLDAFNEFSDGQAVTASANSTNHLNLGPGGSEADPSLYFMVQVDEAFTAAGAATLEVILETDDNSSFSSATTLYSSGAIGKATLVAGHRAVAVRIPKGVEQYIRARYVVATGPMTAGKVSAFLTNTVQEKKSPPSETGK